MKLNRLTRWIKNIWLWLVEGKIVILCILVLVIAVALGLFICRSEASIRLAGFFLQFIGMIFAIRGLLRIRTHFGQPPLRQMFVNWLKRFPRWKKSVNLAAPIAHHTHAGMKARLEIWAPDNPDQPIEKRIECIVKNLDRIKEEQGQHAKAIEGLSESHEKHKIKVVEEQKNMEEKFRLDLESLHTSDLLTSLVGLVWLTVGISMSTMAPELFELFKWVAQ